MSGPLRMSFQVACPVNHAVTVWTAGIGTWWPPDHTVTGQAGPVIVLRAAPAAGSMNEPPKASSTSGVR